MGLVSNESKKSNGLQYAQEEHLMGQAHQGHVRLRPSARRQLTEARVSGKVTTEDPTKEQPEKPLKSSR